MATASAKDTFESETFAPSTFASGMWRGSLIAAVPADFPNVLHVILPNKPEHVICENLPEHVIPINRPEHARIEG